MTDNSEGWDTYAKLVLAELERHNGLLGEIKNKLDKTHLQQALSEKEILNVREDHDALVKTVVDVVTRVGDIEREDVVATAIKRYKKWFVGIAFTILTAVIIPLVELAQRIIQG